MIRSDVRFITSVASLKLLPLGDSASESDVDFKTRHAGRGRTSDGRGDDDGERGSVALVALVTRE